MNHGHSRADAELVRLIEEAWRQHQQFQSSPFLVQPSMPILFFGDLKAYCASPLKVVTVGLNPSKEEFPSSQPFMRFSKAYNAYWSVDNLPIESYIQCLSDYFRIKPYDDWFNAFDLTFKEIGVSFYGSQSNKNIALHTDLLSPLATKKSSNLTGRVQAVGVLLWHSLIHCLEPHIILAIVGKDRRQLIKFKDNGKWQTIFKVCKTGSREKRKTPYLVEACKIEVSENCKPLLVSCDSTRRPLLIYRSAKSKLGRRILKAYLGNPQACSGGW